MLHLSACFRTRKQRLYNLGIRLVHTNNSLIISLISAKLYPQALKASITHSGFSPDLTDQIYSLFVKSGHSLDPYVSSALISHFSKFNDLSHACAFLLDTPNPDVITYNALISGFARVKQSGPVFKLFNELRHLGLVPDVFTLTSLVKSCESSRENVIAHGICLRLGLVSSVFTVSGLIENYSKIPDIGSAEKCFVECWDVDNVVCTTMICRYVWNREFDKAKLIFVQMRDLGLELNEFSLTGVMGALSDVREGKQLHGFGLKMGFLYDCSLPFSNAVMSMYSRCGSKVVAHKLFDEISIPDIVSWTERIGAAYDDEEAFQIFKLLHSRGLVMNEYTLINALSAIRGVIFLEAGKQIHALCEKAGHLREVSVSNALVSMYGKCRQVRDACCVFYHMISRDSVSWNSLITACSENGYFTEALELFSCMRDFFIQPTIHTLVSILETVSNLNCTEQVMQFHSHVIKCGFTSDDSIVSSLIAAYGRCNVVDQSRNVFAEIDKVNLAHVNTMISTLVQSGCYADALEVFRMIWSSDLEVDNNTFSVILKACGAMTDLEYGNAIHSLSLKTGFHQNVYVETALIDIYCKCGSIGEAEKAFRTISADNLAAWNAMIMGYAQHGHCQEVFELLKKMSESGMEPDEITYLGVLTSCCHAGFVSDAHHYLNSMFELHGILPRLEHYACMVDLLGRAGRLKEAKQIIDDMPIQADAHIWQILLSACNIHGNVELGRIAANKLLELQPENDSAYILLSKLYASAGMWNEIRKLRKEMKDKVLHKEPGSSWIQVRGSIHNFLATDTSHCRRTEIYDELLRLYNHMLASPSLEEYNSLQWMGEIFV